MDKDTNKVILKGIWRHNFRQLRTPDGVSYSNVLLVRRKSGVLDEIQVLTFNPVYITQVSGNYVEVTGHLASHRNRSHTPYTKILKEVIADNIQYKLAEGKHYNRVVLTGTIVGGGAHLRTTPQGRVINDFQVVVKRPNGKTDLITVLAWDETAYELGDLQDGERVELEGRLQSRHYRKKKDQIRRRILEVSIHSYRRI